MKLTADKETIIHLSKRLGIADPVKLNQVLLDGIFRHEELTEDDYGQVLEDVWPDSSRHSKALKTFFAIMLDNDKDLKGEDLPTEVDCRALLSMVVMGEGDCERCGGLMEYFYTDLRGPLYDIAIYKCDVCGHEEKKEIDHIIINEGDFY